MGYLLICLDKAYMHVGGWMVAHICLQTLLLSEKPFAFVVSLGPLLAWLSRIYMYVFVLNRYAVGCWSSIVPQAGSISMMSRSG